MDETRKKIGIFGGTFNPIHNGHMMIAYSALEQFPLEQIVFLPTGQTAYKEYKGEDMSRHRLRMVELATESDPRFHLSLTEIENDEVNFTYRTLEKISARHPDCQLYFLLGGDSLRDFDTWRHPERICENATILAAVREDVDKDRINQLIEELNRRYRGICYPLNTPALDISSQEIRRRVAEGLDIDEMVPPAIADYIRDHNLYRQTT